MMGDPAERQAPEVWIGKRVSVWVIGDRRPVVVGELRAVEELGVVVEESGGISALCPWSGISIIRLDESDERSSRTRQCSYGGYKVAGGLERARDVQGHQ